MVVCVTLERQGVVSQGCAGKSMYAREKLPTYEMSVTSSSLSITKYSFHLVKRSILGENIPKTGVILLFF